MSKESLVRIAIVVFILSLFGAYKIGNIDGLNKATADKYNEGYSAGETEGYDKGYKKGFNEGNEAGRQFFLEGFSDRFHNSCDFATEKTGIDPNEAGDMISAFFSKEPFNGTPVPSSDEFSDAIWSLVFFYDDFTSTSESTDD